MVDQMAHRYGMLPSEILARGTTQDIFVFDVYTTYQQYVNEKQARKHKRAEPPIAKPASEDLLERYNRWSERKNNESN